MRRWCYTKQAPLLLLTLSLSLSACSKKKDDPPANTANKPSETKPTETKPTETKPGEVVAPPGEAKRLFTLLGCDKLPKSLKDKYFAGKALEDDTNDANSGGCGVKDSAIGFDEVA